MELGDAEIEDYERNLETRAERIQEIESKISTIREQLASLQATIDNQTLRRADLQQEIAKIREQLTAMDEQAADENHEELREAASLLQAAEVELIAINSECAERSSRSDQAAHELEALRIKQEPMQNILHECLSTVARLEDEIAKLEAENSAAEQSSERIRQQLADLANQRNARTSDFERDQHAEAEQHANAERHRTELATAERRLVEVRHDLGRADAQHRRLDAQLTRVRERIAVLSELEGRLEGLDGGVQEILRVAREDNSQPFGDVRGVIADLFHVDVDSAPLVEVALGERRSSSSSRPRIRCSSRCTSDR